MKPTPASLILKGLARSAPEQLLIHSVVTDNREAAAGSLFVAIKGERADGHDFAADALSRGAVMVLAQRPIDGIPPDKCVVVRDVLDGMIQMGANYRTQFSPLVLGITGSVGKTSTKEFCACIFSAFGQTLKTEGNQNNEIGMPKTLFKMDDETRYAVIEMGMQGPGEIRKLALAARPSGAIITKIGYAHIEQMGSLANVLMAKLEISEGVQPGGPLVLNGDDELLRSAHLPTGLQVVYAGVENAESDVHVGRTEKQGDGLWFEVVDKQYGVQEVFIPTMARHNITNALMAYTAATRLGLNARQTAMALQTYQPAGTRLKVGRVDGVILIEDYYNAGPDSMAAALQTLGEYEAAGQRIAVLGDMLELGAVSEEKHREVAQKAAAAGVDLLITVGPQMALAAEEAKAGGMETAVCKDNAQAAKLLKKSAKSGDVVLLKASRGMKFEEIVDAVQKK